MFVLIMAIFRDYIDYIPNFYGNHMENQRGFVDGLWMACGWLVDGLWISILLRAILRLPLEWYMLIYLMGNITAIFFGDETLKYKYYQSMATPSPIGVVEGVRISMLIRDGHWKRSSKKWPLDNSLSSEVQWRIYCTEINIFWSNKAFSGESFQIGDWMANKFYLRNKNIWVIWIWRYNYIICCLCWRLTNGL